MDIKYTDSKTHTPEMLEDLFLSVDWSSGHYPDKLAMAISRFGSVYSAWDGDKMVGLISTMDDGGMTAYIHYLLVRPEYQGQGIGKELLHLTKEHYKDYLRILLVAYSKERGFYESCGFEAPEDKQMMQITSLWT